MTYAFYKVRKDLHEEWFEEHPTYLLWWCDLLYHATWRNKRISIKNKTIMLLPGEQVASINDLVERWKRGRDMIINFIRLLKEKGLIEKRTANNISIIHINDYNSSIELDNHSEEVTDNPIANQTNNTQRISTYFQKDKADNLSEEESDNLTTQTDNLADNLADNHSEEVIDNPIAHQNPNKQRISKGLQEDKTDNLAEEETDNLADNLADNTPIYKEKRRKISTTTTHMNFKESSEEGIAIDAAIERLIADQDQLLLIQRYTGIPVTDIMRWSIGYVDRCGIQKGGFNAKGYSDVVSHFTDWLLCQKNKGKSLKPNQVQTKSQAKEVWNKVKAHLLISSVVPEELISSLDFVQYDPENLSIGIIAPDIKTKTIVNKEYKKIIEESFSRYTSSNIKVRCGIMKQQESQTITR